MTDKQVQAKLNQLAKIANELDQEAKRRYGSAGSLFFESDGAFHLMDGDESDSRGNRVTAQCRQAHVRFSSRGYCTMGAGVW